jgi:hypothetical protein
MATAREGTGVNDFPLVRGGKIPPAALRWLAEVERVFFQHDQRHYFDSKT